MDAVAEQQAIELKSKGHDVTIFTFDNNNYLPSVKIEKLGWPKSPVFNYLYRLLYPIDMYNVIRSSEKLKKYDILIAHFYPMTYLSYFAKKKYPSLRYIFYNHGIVTSRDRPLLIRSYGKILEGLTLFSTSNADCVISISEYLKNITKNKSLKNEVIYNKINITKFDYNINEVDYRILNKFGNHENNYPVFLYVGVLTHYKGISLLIKSFKIFLKTFPNGKLILVGKMAYGFKLSDFLDESLNSKVFFFDSVNNSELGYLYNECDVYLSASTWEGFNLPIVEAQLLGKPVVAFDICAHNEVVLNGKTGYLIEPFDTYEFANAMVKVYENRYDMGNNAKNWALQFSTENHNSESISKFIREWLQ